MQEPDKVIDVQVDEARRLAKLQTEINKKFLGAPKDLKIWGQLVDEVKTRAAEIGFIVQIYPQTSPNGNWIPICEIVGRTDKHLASILEEQGPDIERKAWDSKRVKSAELRKEGVDPELLG